MNEYVITSTCIEIYDENDHLRQFNIFIQLEEGTTRDIASTAPQEMRLSKR